jgi:hypothetical protein
MITPPRDGFEFQLRSESRGAKRENEAGERRSASTVHSPNMVISSEGENQRATMCVQTACREIRITAFSGRKSNRSLKSSLAAPSRCTRTRSTQSRSTLREEQEVHYRCIFRLLLVLFSLFLSSAAFLLFFSVVFRIAPRLGVRLSRGACGLHSFVAQ